VADYQWAVGLVAGVLVSSIGAVLNQALPHVFAVRRERAAKAREVLVARYEAGKRALELYLQYTMEPYPLQQDGEAEELDSVIAEPFGARFAHGVVSAFFDRSNQDVPREIEHIMRARLAELESELGYPTRLDLAERMAAPRSDTKQRLGG
jgi:hypothetical protein